MVVATVTSKTGMPQRTDRYAVSVQQAINFRKNGFLVVPGLVSEADAAELRQHTEDLMQGRLPQQRKKMSERDPGDDSWSSAQDLEAPPDDLTPEDKAQYFLRIHMLHRKLELHERYMLHPRVLDVLEVIIGPDVLALQTMLFLKPPGKPGQGWHQDSYYIPTHPDTLCGAWICIDDCDELNGAMWMASGSGNEPIYPPKEGYGFGDRAIKDIVYVGGVSDTVDANNDLAKIADKYDQVLVSAKAGDVVFFNGHIIHRSKQNYSTDRFRRSFVSHYCNARSFTQWAEDFPDPGQERSQRYDAATGMVNGSHILARGDTHLPFAKPKFGTPCAALLTLEERGRDNPFAVINAANAESGQMETKPADPNVEHDDEEETKPVTSGY